MACAVEAGPRVVAGTCERWELMGAEAAEKAGLGVNGGATRAVGGLRDRRFCAVWACVVTVSCGAGVSDDISVAAIHAHAPMSDPERRRRHIGFRNDRRTVIGDAPERCGTAARDERRGLPGRRWASVVGAGGGRAPLMTGWTSGSVRICR